MIENKFARIDKSLVCKEKVALFSIYYPTELSSQMECLVEKGAPLVAEKKALIASKKALYVLETDMDRYREFCEKQNSLKNKEQYEENTKKIYTKATSVIDEIYHNPETLGGYEKTKDVVNDLVYNILDDKFTMHSLMKIATHDYYTHTHSLNVSVYALSLGAHLKLSKKELALLGESALLHDLGKSKIAKEIINKNGKLTDEEFNKMKKHPELGFHLAVAMGIKDKNILYGIRHHHEKMDGSGYPSKLRGESIPLFARIIALCDIFDALTSERSYKAAMSTFDALKLMKKNMSNHVDLKLLNKMIKMFK